MIARDSRRARLVLALASALATLVACAVVYEVAARIRYQRWRAGFDNNGAIGLLTVASPNRTLIWEYRPHGESQGIRTNRWGFRDVDYETRAKPAGTRRVAFLGDSVTLGMGVPPEQTFVRRVADLAAAGGTPVQTLNFGVDGYHALQLRELLVSKVPAFEPDDVVYMMSLNDFDFEDSSGRKIVYFRPPALFFPGDLARRFRRLWGGEFHHDHFAWNRDAVFDAVVAMRDAAKAHGARFLVAVLPVFPDTTDPVDYFEHYPFRDLDLAIETFGRDRGVEVRVLSRAFPPRGSARPFALDIWHLSALGHATVAQALLPAVAPGAAGAASSVSGW